MEGYKIVDDGDGFYRVVKENGVWYLVIDAECGWWCNCPSFTFQQLEKHGKCKHVRMVEGWINKNSGCSA